MSNLSITSNFLDPLDWESEHWESQPPRVMTLLPEQVQQAADWCQPVSNPNQQWQVYLNALALLGFKQWLHQRAPELTLIDEQCSIQYPIYASLINAVYHLQVGEFKLCILAIGSLTDTQISIPRAVLDLPEFAAHWYVLVEVLEDAEQACVYGCSSYDTLAQQVDSLSVELDWNYAVPLQWFTLEPDVLLLSLRCLNSQAMSLPIAAGMPDQRAEAKPDLKKNSRLYFPKFLVRNELYGKY
ncbi:MAG: DUF1822 family protein [Leptolyngbyaceae cyanobacterium CRU_2_3]|nr:DUF1822 family protein [Leptolyngbyaceae cyanobacterium CRU_2_3]